MTRSGRQFKVTIFCRVTLDYQPHGRAQLSGSPGAGTGEVLHQDRRSGTGSRGRNGAPGQPAGALRSSPVTILPSSAQEVFQQRDLATISSLPRSPRVQAASGAGSVGLAVHSETAGFSGCQSGRSFPPRRAGAGGPGLVLVPGRVVEPIVPGFAQDRGVRGRQGAVTSVMRGGPIPSVLAAGEVRLGIALLNLRPRPAREYLPCSLDRRTVAAVPLRHARHYSARPRKQPHDTLIDALPARLK